MARLEFHIVDVFTDVPFAGNPLAVVLGADDLDTAQLQTLARQFQLSETAFPLTPSVAEADRGVAYRLRIFTTANELPFAGHPSVGTAWLMAQLGRVQPGRVIQACVAGELPLAVAADGGPVELTGAEPKVSEPIDQRPLLAALGLGVADLAPDAPPSRLAGTGLDYSHLLVRPESLALVSPDMAALKDYGPPGRESGGIYVASWDPATRTARARMFAGDMATAEDPATGSAALGFGVWLVASGLLPADDTSEYTVRQGVEMGRPSILHGTVTSVGGRAVEVKVRGQAAFVAQGWIEIPAVASEFGVPASSSPDH